MLDSDLSSLRNQFYELRDQKHSSLIKNISYSNFLAANIDLEEHLTDNKMNAIFKIFDIENKGVISIQNLKDAFTKFG